MCGLTADFLKEHNIDERLATHLCNLFIRSPIPAYEKEFMFPCCGDQPLIVPKRAKQEKGSPKQMSNSPKSSSQRVESPSNLTPSKAVSEQITSNKQPSAFNVGTNLQEVESDEENPHEEESKE
jgi:hypothetical protein